MAFKSRRCIQRASHNSKALYGPLVLRGKSCVAMLTSAVFSFASNH